MSTSPSRTVGTFVLCGPPKGCTCPEVAWSCVCREGNVKRGCDSFDPLPRDRRGLVRCKNCDWQDWQHAASDNEGAERG